MIVRPRPGSFALLFILRGSVVPAIANRLLFIVSLACLVWMDVHMQWLVLPSIPLAPFSFLGLALSVFLGFRNNACYDRWWEARKQWGELIVQARSFSRESAALLGNSPTRVALIRAIIGFTYALVESLRDSSASNQTSKADSWLSRDLPALERENKPDSALAKMNVLLTEAWRRGELTDILYQGLLARLQAMSAVQTACERIRHTPTPFAYSLLLHRTAWMFCLLLPFALVETAGAMTPLIVGITAYTYFGLDALGDELEEPFGLGDNDLPLNAMARTIERELLYSLGETDLPPPLSPVDYRLH